MAVTSEDERAVITGEVILHPIQLADPEVLGNFDTDQALALQTRRAFITRHADIDALVFATHFSAPSVGYIVSDGDTWRFAPPEGNPDSGEFR